MDPQDMNPADDVVVNDTIAEEAVEEGADGMADEVELDAEVEEEEVSDLDAE